MRPLSFFFLGWLLFAGRPAGAQGVYEDLSHSSGVMDDAWNIGVSAGDYDNDGDLDLYVCTRKNPNKLYRNLGGFRFEEVGAAAGVAYEHSSRAAAWADLDNDGDLDLYVGGYDAPDRLYLNNGDGTFSDITAQAGIDNNRRVIGVMMTDIDRDGRLEIYVSNYRKENRLYYNNGDGTFSDLIYPTGARSEYSAMGAFFFDYDRDGDDDLYLSHDGQPNFLYQNNSLGRFNDVTAQAGVGHAGFAMGVDFGDINNDGWLDIYLTNLYENVLYLNNGDGTFADISAAAGVDDVGMGWGTTFLDYDNDGWLDIYVGNESYYSPHPNVLYRNNGDLTFSIVEDPAGAQSMLGTYGLVAADLDNDGAQDLFLANEPRNDRNQALRNKLAENHWIALELEGTTCNRSAIGAWVDVKDEFGNWRCDQVSAGGGYASQNPLGLHFGLGSATRIDSLIIRWPGGPVQHLGALEADRYYRVIEGRAPEVRQLTTDIQLPVSGAAIGMQLFPNPTTGPVQWSVATTRPPQAILIVDASGRIVRQETPVFEQTDGGYQGQLQLAEAFPAGAYTVLIVTPEGIGGGMLVKQ